MGRSGALCWVALWVVGCGQPARGGADAPEGPSPTTVTPSPVASSSTPLVVPEAVATEPAPAESAATKAEPAPLPRSCDVSAAPAGPVRKDGEPPPCYPPSDFVERLCGAIYPSVPLVMFKKDSPWRRGYLRGETKAWTTAPGGQNDKLEQDEEILVLQEDASRSEGVQYDSGAAFYALRWDGSCVKLTEEELMQYVPWGKKTPLLQWHLLDDAQQSALREDPKVDAAYLASRKQCRSSGPSDAACKKLQRRLSDLIVAHVRAGADLPDPAFRP